LPVEGRARYRFSQALCSFALRDEPVFRKPLRVTKPACVAYRYSFYSSFFFALSISFPFFGDSTLIYPYFSFTRVALRLSYTFLSLPLNEQRRAGSSTSLLIKWPRESTPGFFYDEILLTAASRRQFSFSRRRQKTTRHETWHCMIMCAVSPLLMLKNSAVT